MPDTSLVRQRITVVLADDRELELLSANPDLVRWDITRQKHGWGSMEDAPMLWATFVAWAAAKRTGVYEGTWDTWANQDCLSVDFDVEGLEEVDPTRMGPGSSSV